MFGCVSAGIDRVKAFDQLPTRVVISTECPRSAKDGSPPKALPMPSSSTQGTLKKSPLSACTHDSAQGPVTDDHAATENLRSGDVDTQ